MACGRTPTPGCSLRPSSSVRSTSPGTRRGPGVWFTGRPASHRVPLSFPVPALGQAQLLAEKELQEPTGCPRPSPVKPTQGDGGADRQPRPPGPYAKPLHYSKTIIVHAMLRRPPRPHFRHRVPASWCFHRPGQALNDSRCRCNFYQGLFLVKSLFVSERCHLAFSPPSLIPWLIYHFPEPWGHRGSPGLLKSLCFSSKSRPTLPGPVLCAV